MIDQSTAHFESNNFTCSSCGAKLEYAPGKKMLKCPYCGSENEINKRESKVEELDFYQFFAIATEKGESEEKQTVACSSCKAVSTVDSHLSTTKCPFCGSQLTAQAKASRLIKPGALLPFKIDRTKAVDEFRTWISGLWFVPGELKRYAITSGGIRGMYIPAWTYDSRVTTKYDGERGDDYNETEYYETEDSNGNTVTRSRMVTHTRWQGVCGDVVTTFDDVLVLAGRSLPSDILVSLEPWDLKNLVPASDEYLSGFQVEAYQVDLGAGFENAKSIMDAGVKRTIERHIGGEHQRITAARSQYDDITFKHILLPVWISAYRYKDKTYRFLVNARTGQVQGERPWSIAKIALVVFGALFVLCVILMVVMQKH